MMRLFVEIPVSDRESLYPVLKKLKTVPGIRTTDISQIHITMVFLGETDSNKVTSVIKSVKKSVEGFTPFDIEIGKMGYFGGNGKSSIIWIGAKPSDTLSELAKRIRSGLDENGFEYDRKPFKAHVTVGRSKDGTVPGNDVLSSFDKVTKIHCDRVLIMSSEFGKNGVKHVALSDAVFH